MALIYHYCSPYAFQQIMERECFWLSSTNNMNDFTEGKLLAEVLDGFLEKNKSRYGQVWIDLVKSNFKEYLSPKYITCFSKDNDSLSQWRAYAQDGEGVAIGFDDTAFGITEKVSMPSIIPSKSLTLKDVKYESIDKIELDITRIIKSSMQVSSSEEEAAYLVGIHYSDLYISVKNMAFSEEKEKRLVYSAMIYEDVNDNTIELMNPIGEMKFRIVNGLLTSYFEFKFKKTAVSEIVLGPKNKFTDQDMKLFLRMNKYNHVEVCRSAATYR